MDYYWELVQKDGTSLMIPPSAVELVKKRWDNREPIHTSSMTIPASEIRSFRITGTPYGQQPLLEAAAYAFDEPQINAEGSTVGRWVKKQVSQAEWIKKYSAIPAYKKLADEGGLVTVAFLLPVHQINSKTVQYCNDDEIQELERGKHYN